MKNKLGDRMIKQLLNSFIAKNRDLSVSNINFLLATDKSRYFAQPRPIIVNYEKEPRNSYGRAHL